MNGAHMIQFSQKTYGQLILFFSVCSFIAFSPHSIAKNLRQTTLLTADAVAVADSYSANAAEYAFKRGGNAADAAVAIAFTLAVTYPEAGNIGGGGFMTLYFDGKPYFLDYREKAPLLATKNMYLDKDGNVIDNLSLYGYRAAGVPGTVAGMWDVHQRFGKLPWRDVLAPAIHYAENGFIVSKDLEERRERAEPHFIHTNFDRYFKNLKSGTLFKQPELAMVLKRIAKEGPTDFYKGKTAALIVKDMQEHQGLITREDLASYRAVWRKPIIAHWNQYEIITAPPPSSGGIGLIQLLKMKKTLKNQFVQVPLNSAHYIHLISEIEKRVFADRAEYLGDPDFYKVPVNQLLNEEYINKRAHEINPEKPSDTKLIKPGLKGTIKEKNQTTHFSVIDQWGNAISNTYTLNGNFGAGVVVDGAGFLLNNEMDDFSIKPGTANIFGVIGKDANAIAPGKRPLSSMTPTILLQDNKVKLVIGTPGGSRIFTSIFQVITNIYDFKLPLDKAVSEMRFHHQLLPPQTIFYEPYKPIAGELAQQLKNLGYVLKNQEFNGDIQLIEIDKNHPIPITDPRGRGIVKIISTSQNEEM